MSQLKGVIFDLDGVLLDSAAFHRRAWERMAAELGCLLPANFFLEHFGRTNDAILRLLLERRLAPEEARRLSERKESLFREEAAGSICLFPGVEALLAGLRREHWRIALGTATPRSNVEFLFREVGLSGFLDAATSADDVRRGKPDPEIFLRAGGQLSLPAERCLVVEDTFIGIEAARAARMKCVAVATTHPRHRLLRDSAADLVVERTGDLSPAMLLDCLGSAASPGLTQRG